MKVSVATAARRGVEVRMMRVDERGEGSYLSGMGNEEEAGRNARLFHDRKIGMGCK